MEIVIEALVERVWRNPNLERALEQLESHWLSKTLNINRDAAPISLPDVARYVEAAAILACSLRPDHRLAAYRISTYAFELFDGQIDGLNAAVRTVLTRLGNFPSLSTHSVIDNSLNTAPWSLAEEELIKRAQNEVQIAGQTVALTDFQKALWTALVKGQSLAISAPTSTGKSFVLQSFITERISDAPHFAACYLVPTRALITQVHNDISQAAFSHGLTDIDFVTVPIEEDEPLPDRAVFIFTQERLQLLLKNHPEKPMDFLVVDEAHSVQDGDRGVILQTVIDELNFRNPSMQVLFASPSVSNLDIFGEMIGRKDISPETTEQTAVSQNFIELHVTSATHGEIDIFARNGDQRRYIGKSVLRQTLSSRVECLVHLAHAFGAGKQSIVYADGQADAEKLAFQLADLRAITSEGRESAVLNELADLAREAVHPNYILAETVKHGVGFHYGNIPALLRNAIEQAFISGELRYLVCTSTLLAGVNLPAQNIFLCQPSKSRGTPLNSIDFWNLAGRAGRLRREFQGNIYLINYSKWGAQPLAGPRLAEITPAIEATIRQRGAELASIIRGDEKTSAGPSDIGLQTIFVRLLSDYKLGRLANTLDNVDRSYSSDNRADLESALEMASNSVTLPAHVLNASPTISAHRQQRLYDTLMSLLSSRNETEGRKLLLAHPREPSAFDSYVAALTICHGTIIDRAGTIRQNRFFALMLLKWMQGVSIAELVDGRANFNRSERIDVSIRRTLDLVEKELRFEYVRVFGCYTEILAEALDDSGLSDLRKSMPSIALFLEVGASDKTMISFISLGLSRLAAKRLNNICPVKSLNPKDARTWLARQNLEILGFSKFIQQEVRFALAQRAA